MFLVGFKSHFTKENTCKCDPEPITRKLIVPRGELNYYYFDKKNMVSNYLLNMYLYS